MFSVDFHIKTFQDGWTPLHCSAQAGHLQVVKLLVESGASTNTETSNGRIPLWFAAAENKLKVVSFLIQQPHDSYKLLEDRKVNMFFKSYFTAPSPIFPTFLLIWSK